MYIAFIIQENNEDLVSFHTKESNGNYRVFYEHITRGDTDTLNYYINQYMRRKKKKKEVKEAVKNQ